MSSKNSRNKSVSTAVKPREKSVTSHRRMSKSFESYIKSRRQNIISDNEKVPVVVSSNLDDDNFNNTSKKDTKRTKFAEPVCSKVSRESTTPRLGLRSTSITSKFYNYDEINKKTQLLNNINFKNSDVEFGQSIGSLIFILSFPVIIILSKITLENEGILIPFPQKHLQFGNYYNQDVFKWSAALVVIQLLISLVLSAKILFILSGLMNLVVGFLIVAGLKHYKISIKFILEIVTKNNVSHIVASTLLCFIILTVIYVTDKLKKQTSKSKNFNIFQKWFFGTSFNPTLGSINIKLALNKYSHLFTILCNYLAIIDSLENDFNLHLYVIAGLQIFHAIDRLVIGFSLLPSFYLQKEKFGYWTTIQLLLIPAINFLPIQILLAKKMAVNYTILGISAILFLLSYSYQWYSDYITHQYIKSLCSTKNSISNAERKSLKHRSVGFMIAHVSIILPIIEPSIDSLLASWPVLVYILYYLFNLTH